MSITIVITFITLTYLTYITPADITAAIVKSVAVASVFIGISIAVMSCYSLKRYHKCLGAILTVQLAIFPAAAPPTEAERAESAMAEKRQVKRQKREQLGLLRIVERTRIR